ncbi:prenyltransferase [Thalassotalea piscium]
MKKILAALPSIRPPFLLLAPICVCFGASIASYQQGSFNSLHFVLAIIGALFAAIAVNTLNEYQDFQSGLDLNTIKTPFSGGSGLLGKHPELAPTVLAFAIFSSLLIFLIGCYFLYTIGSDIIAIGLIGLAVIWLYTKWLNKLPFICLISPGLGFGILMVLGSYFVVTGTHNPLVWQLAVIPFLLVNNLLLLNQYPDIDADQAAGRNHIVIKYGIKVANMTYLLISLLTLITIIVLYLSYQLPLLFLTALIPSSLCLIVFKGMLLHGKHIAEHPIYLVMNVIAANVTPIVIALVLVMA